MKIGGGPAQSWSTGPTPPTGTTAGPGWDDSPSFEAALEREREGRLSAAPRSETSMAYLRNLAATCGKSAPPVRRAGSGRSVLALAPHGGP